MPLKIMIKIKYYYIFILLSILSSSIYPFTETTYNFSITEESPINTFVGKIDINPNYIYRLNPSTTNLFNFNNQSGEITVKNKIDRESLKFNFKNSNEIRLIIVTQPSSLITINVQIKDIDDNKPSFNDIEKSITILENTPIDTKIILPQAIDADDGENGKIQRYWIENINDTHENIPFEVSKIGTTDDDEMLYLIIKGLLDREKKSFYKFNIVGDGSYNNELMETRLPVTVNITDVNDNAPIFEKNNYTIILTSQNKKGDVIGRVVATDLDEGENGKVTYKISSNSFSINTNNGEIILLKNKVNCSSSCILIIEASDNGTEPLRSRCFVTVKSFEENLNTPEISFRLYPPGIDFANILENATVGGTVAVLTVNDNDKGDNGETVLDIINGNENNYFYLEKGKNFGILRVGEEWVNYGGRKKKFKKNDFFEVTFEVSDKGEPKKSSRKSLKIFVRPSEDIPPTLSQSIIKTKIGEWSVVGTLITRVLVETPPNNDKLEFHIMKNERNDDEYFYLNKESGYIYLRRKLNITERDEFTIDVSVKKEAPYITSSVCRIDINVIPSNNPPIFDKNIWEFRIPSNFLKKDSFIIGRIKASDNDKGDDGKIRYQIVDPSNIYTKIFRIKEKTGDIYLNSNINYEMLKNKYIFQVTAKDMGSKPKVSTTNVIILLNKKNFLPPYFPIINNYQVIRLHEFPDTHLLKVTASIDDDNTKDSKLTYYLIDNEYTDYIDLHHTTGEIKLKKPINDRFKVGDAFIIEIGAKDGNDNIVKENCKIIFEIINDNQNLNIFSPTTKWRYNIDGGGTIKNVTIGKIDTIDNIDIKKLGGYELLNCNNILTINKLTGEIIFKGNDTSYKKSNYICIVKLGKSSKKLYLNVKTENYIYNSEIDNLKDVYITVNHKTIGQQIFTIPLSNENQNFIYSIDTLLLEVDNKTGVIRLSNKITDVINQIQATITITDHNIPTKILKTFKINILFEGKEKKVKSMRGVQFDVKENVPIGYVIGNINKNSDDNTWYFYNNTFVNQQKISILGNGSIVVSGYLDRENISSVKETFTNGIEIVNVFVNIVDVNDNSPTCEGNQKFVISSNLEIFSPIGIINCNDVDFGKNSIITYKLLSHTETFHIDNKKGIIRNLKKITTNQNNILVEVKDLGGLKTKTQFSIIPTIDVNEKIIFEKRFYHWDINHIDSIKVKSKGNVTYKLENYDEIFEISKNGRIKVKKSSLLIPTITYNLTVLGISTSSDKIIGIGKTFVLIEPPKPIKIKPIFTKFDSYIKLDDNTPPGSIITTVEASIFDSRTPTIALDNILYTLGIEGNYNGTFEIDLYSGEIILSKHLTTTQKEYTLKVKAVAGNGMISEKEMTIIIEKSFKKIDNKIDLLTDTFYLIENNPKNFIIGEVKFTNTNIDNNIDIKILYDTTLNDNFEINDNNLIVKNSIDREEFEEIKLLLQLTQNNIIHRKWLTIKVIDTNDNYPECNGINAVVIKKLPLTIQLPCVDYDFGINSSLGYSLSDSKEMVKFNDIITIDLNGNLIIDKKFNNMNIKNKPSYVTINVYDRAFDEKNGMIINDLLRKSTQRQVALIKWNEDDSFKFEKKLYNFVINSSINIGDVIGNVRPSKESFIFIVDQTIDGMYVGWKNFFDIDDNGNLKVRRKFESKMEIIKLLIIGVDRDGGTTETEVIININTTKYLFNFEKSYLPPVINLSIDEDNYKVGNIIGNITKILSLKNDDNLMSFSFDTRYSEIIEVFEINKYTGIILLKNLTNVNGSYIFYGTIKISLCTNDIDYFIPISINININDNKKPKILSCIENQTYFIREDAPFDSIIGTILAQNDDQLIYELIDPPNDIKIEPTTGIIRVNGSFNHEKISFYRFGIKVTNSLNFSSTCDTYLYIEDINNNKPQVMNKEMTIYIDEDSKPGDKIFKFDIHDDDSDCYLNYKISPETNPYGIFNINDDDGTIYLQGTLDYEMEKKHQLEITIYDNIFPNIVNYIKTTVTIIVNDINDNPPTFQTPSSTFFIDKDKKINDLIGIVNAFDPDEGYGGVIHYRIIPETLPNNEVYIDNVYGYLYLNTNNITNDEIIFTIEGYDNGQPMLKSKHEIRLIKEKESIIEGDDKEIVKINIKENTPIGSLLYKFDNKNDIIGYSSSPMCRYISSNGVILIDHQIDYEMIKNFTCTIKSINNIMIGQVIVNVEDVNDNIPIFYEKVKEINILEGINNDLPMAITEMLAYDNDENLNGLIKYSLIDGPSEYFSINSTSGIIYLTKPLDREVKSKYILTIEASDSGININNNYGNVIINVVDINDNPPTFNKPLYYVKIEENTKPIDNFIEIIGNDKDENENGYIIYSIENNENDYTGTFPFSINSKTGQISLLKSLNYEDKNLWNFTVVGEDNGKYNYFKSTVPVVVEVQNINDKTEPIIRNTLFDVYIKENTKRDSIIFAIDSIEKISTNLYKSDTLKYSLTENDSQYFYIDENGVIYLKDALDEGKNNYDIGVIVTNDNGYNTTTKLSIYTTTQLRFPKLLPLLKSRIALREDVHDIDILKIEATNNGNDDNVIKYFIASGDPNNDFYIDPLSGVLSVRKLDREIFPGYNLIIGVSLSNYMAYSSYQRVQVHVIDVNEAPRFILPIYEVKVEENEMVPKKLVTVHAIDEDSPEFNEITYSIIDGNDNNDFSINNKTGEITLIKSLDAEVQNKYILLVEAKDNGNLSTTTFVLINVKDQNDNSPKFTRLFSPEIYENNHIGEVIATITSTDLDIDPENRNNLYYLENNYNDTFNLDNKSGELKVMKVLDREEVSEYKLRVTAKDEFWQISTTFFVTVKDQNDNKPKFDRNVINIKLNGGEKYGDILCVVKSTDKDEGKNSKIIYQLDDPKTEIVYIEPESGKVIFISRSNMFEDKVKIKVKALDMGDTPNEAFITLVIEKEINNNNMVPLKYDNSIEIVDQLTIPVWENTNFNSKLFEFDKNYIITSITCPKNKNNLFNEGCEKENLFEIKNQTLYLIGKLDYETESLYSIKLQYTDKSKILNIKVLDVNEYFPVIIDPINDELNTTHKISKYSKPNTILTSIEAMDLDLGKGSELNFYINSQSNIINGISIDKKVGLITLQPTNNLLTINEDTLTFDVMVKNGKLDRKAPKHDIITLSLTNSTPFPIFDNPSYHIELSIDKLENKMKLLEFNFLTNHNTQYTYSIYPENKNDDGLICIDKNEGFITICNNITTSPTSKFKPKTYKYIITILENIGPKNKIQILRSKSILTVKINKKIDDIPKMITYTIEGTKQNTNIAILNIKKNEKVEVDDSKLREIFTINNEQKVLINKKVIKRQSPNVDYINIPLKYTNNNGKIRKEIVILGIERLPKNIDRRKISNKNIIIQGTPNYINLNIYDNDKCIIKYNTNKTIQTCKMGYGKLSKASDIKVHQNNVTYKIIGSFFNDYPNEGVWLQIDTPLPSGIGEILYQIQKKFNDMIVRLIGVKNDNINVKSTKKEIFISMIDTFNRIINKEEVRKIIKKFITDNHLDDKVKIIDDKCQDVCGDKNFCNIKIIPITNDIGEYSYYSYSWYGPVIDVTYNCYENKESQNNNIKKCFKRPFFVSQEFGQNYHISQLGDCQNGGYCDTKTELCTCLRGFKGNYCEEDINECMESKNICGIDGRCINTPGNYKCICKDGVEKINCDDTDNVYNKNNTCNGNVCKNGFCVPKDDGDSMYCLCNKGYYGDTCEVKIYSFEYGSFIKVDVKNDNDIEEISFDFNTKQENGILFYSYSLDNSYDYFAIDLINGNIRISLNRSLTNELINEFFYTPINDGIWKRVHLIFTHNSIVINLKGCNEKGTECVECTNDICKNEIETIYGRFTLPSMAFLLGGIGNDDDDDDEIINRSNQIISPEFFGCMKDIYINNLPLNDYNVVVENMIDYCPMVVRQNNCQEDICSKYGKCQNDLNGYTCKCNGIFDTDSSCKDIIQPVSLGDGQVAFELTSNSKKLLQFISTNRSNIENLPSLPKKNIQRRRMSGDTFSDIFSYTSNNILSSSHYSKNSLENQNLEIDFKTNHTDGVLLSIYSINLSTIFMLQINNDTLNYCVYDGLTNIFTIEISKDISNLHWHRIGIITSKTNPNTISFKLNGEVIVKDIDNKYIPTFVHKDLSAILIGAAKSTSFVPFKGCVRRLIINDYGYSMISNIKKPKVDSLFNLKHLGQVEVGCNVPSINENDCDDCIGNFDQKGKKLNDLGCIILIAMLFLFILIIISIIYFLCNNYQWKSRAKKSGTRKRVKNRNEIMENCIFPNLDNIPRSFVSYQNNGISSFSSYENIGTNTFVITNTGNINPGFSSNTHLSNTIDFQESNVNPSIHNLTNIYDAPLINRTSIIQSNIFTKDYYQNPTLEMDETSNNNGNGTEKRCRRLVTFSPTNGISYINDNTYNYPSSYYITDDGNDDGKESPYL